MTLLDWFVNTNYQRDYIGARSLLIDTDLPGTATMQLIELGYPIAGPDSGFSITADEALVKDGRLPLGPAAYAVHLGERVYIYPFGYVAVMAIDGSFKLFHVKD